MKTILMTGATSGIGLESSVQLAEQGHQVVMVGRDPAKTEAALASVKERSGSDLVESLLADFSSQSSTRALADQVLKGYDRLDVLVNNAGTVFDKRTVTEDGIEATFAVNHLAPFLLTSLLLDRLVASAPARIVNVSSSGHYAGTLNFDDLGYERGYWIMKAYSRSKLAMVLSTRTLAAQLEGTGVTANALHPGTVATNIWGGAPWFARPLLAVAKRVSMISPEKGGSHITYLATDPAVEGMNGLYFDDDEPKRPSRLALDDELAARLWKESERLLGL